MGYINGSLSRFLHRQQHWRGNGRREIEPSPEHPARSARDALWLEEINKPKPRRARWRRAAEAKQ
jgi:hypothetical protein